MEEKVKVPAKPSLEVLTHWQLITGAGSRIQRFRRANPKLDIECLQVIVDIRKLERAYMDAHPELRAYHEFNTEKFAQMVADKMRRRC